MVVELLDHKETVRSLDFSKDGSLQLMSGSRDGTLKMWDLNNEGNMYYTHKMRAKVNSCKFSPNGKLVAAVGTNKTVSTILLSSNNGSVTIRMVNWPK